MLQKKISTLACAIAIVGIGACFLPPEHIPVPPVPPYLVNVHSFSIQVLDASGQDLIDEGAMSRSVASSFNQLWSQYPVRANLIQTPTHSDARLRIRIDRKSASPSSSTIQGKQQWAFELGSSSTLTTADGRLIWQSQEDNSHFAIWLENGLPHDGWNSRIVRQEAAYSLAMTMGEILNGRASHSSSEKHP